MKTEQQEQESSNSLIPKVEAVERESRSGAKAKQRQRNAKRQLLKTAEEIKKYNSIKKIKRAE